MIVVNVNVHGHKILVYSLHQFQLYCRNYNLIMLFHQENAHIFPPFGNHLIWQKQKLFANGSCFSVSVFLCKILCKKTIFTSIESFADDTRVLFSQNNMQTSQRKGTKPATHALPIDGREKFLCGSTANYKKKINKNVAEYWVWWRDMHSLRQW